MTTPSCPSVVPSDFRWSGSRKKAESVVKKRKFATAAVRNAGLRIGAAVAFRRGPGPGAGA
jgi:hypothetical protein